MRSQIGTAGPIATNDGGSVTQSEKAHMDSAPENKVVSSEETVFFISSLILLGRLIQLVGSTVGAILMTVWAFTNKHDQAASGAVLIALGVAAAIATDALSHLLRDVTT